MFKAYPKFSAFLKEVFSDGDILEKGASEEEIKIVERNIGIKLPVSKENNKIFYYSHEENKVRFLCKSINELMEKEFARYNREI